LGIALRLAPAQVTLVPERREEITTEGGLRVVGEQPHLRTTIRKLEDAGIRTSLFIDPDEASVRASRELGATAIELHTGSYAHNPGASKQLDALRSAA